MTSYRVSPSRQAVFYVMWGGIAGPFLLGGICFKHEGMLVVGVFISLLTSPILALVTFYVKLLLFEDGLILRQLGYTLSTRWSNVVEFDATKGREGFVLREPIEDKGAYQLARLVGQSAGMNNSMYRGGRPDLVAERRFIPIEPFGFWVRHGKLLDDIEKLGVVTRKA